MKLMVLLPVSLVHSARQVSGLLPANIGDIAVDNTPNRLCVGLTKGSQGPLLLYRHGL